MLRLTLVLLVRLVLLNVLVGRSVNANTACNRSCRRRSGADSAAAMAATPLAASVFVLLLLLQGCTACLGTVSTVLYRFHSRSKRGVARQLVLPLSVAAAPCRPGRASAAA